MEYTYRDFWSKKPKSIRWLYRIASYLIAPLSVCIFNNANCIGVYHDLRIMETFKETVQKLQSGVSVVIFPEHELPHNNIVCEFQDRFIDVARMYYKKQAGKSPLSHCMSPRGCIPCTLARRCALTPPHPWNRSESASAKR